MSRDRRPQRPPETPASGRDGAVAVKLVAALDRLARAQRQQRQAAASALGITPLQGEVLMILGDGPPPEALIGLIAREVGVSQPTVTDSVNALERKGLVRRSKATDDQRRTLLELTAAGHTLVGRLVEAEAAQVTAVAGMPEVAQHAAYVALLELIARFVETGLIEVARTCLTCAYLGGSAASGRRCLLLDMALPDDALRVNCPEHVPVGAG